jgi:DNA-binding beta-propeller fold protein YncE
VLGSRTTPTKIVLGSEGRGAAGAAARGARWTAMLLAATAALLMAGPAGADDPRVESVAIVAAGYGGATLQAPAGVVYDAKRGELVVANSGLHQLEYFRLDGRAKARVRHRVRRPDGETVDGQPRALAMTGDGRLLVVDYQAAYVDVLDFRGRSVGRLELPPENSTLSDGPGCVAVEPAGTILVGTRGEVGKVFRFGADLRPQGAWGEGGSGPGQLSRVSCLAATPDGRVVVGCVSTELAVQVFDGEGKFLKGFGRHDVGAGNFSFPAGVAITGDGRIWVVDELRQIVQVFDAQGEYLGKVGTGGEAPGEFLYPNSIAAVGDTLFAVTERVGNRMQLLKLR